MARRPIEPDVDHALSVICHPLSSIYRLIGMLLTAAMRAMFESCFAMTSRIESSCACIEARSFLRQLISVAASLSACATLADVRGLSHAVITAVAATKAKILVEEVMIDEGNEFVRSAAE